MPLWIDIMYNWLFQYSIDEYMANSDGDSLSELLFSFPYGENIFVCDVCGLRSTSFESTAVLNITPTPTKIVYMEELIMQDFTRLVLVAIRTLGMSNVNIFYNLLNILLSLLTDLTT